MGRARNVRTARTALKPKLEREFLGFEPATDSTAARLTVVHLWSGIPFGPNPANRLFVVAVPVVIQNVIVASNNFRGRADAVVRYDCFATPLELAGLSTDIIVARDHLEAVTGRRFWLCGQCEDHLRIGALWCEACGTPTKGQPTTAAQHAEKINANA